MSEATAVAMRDDAPSETAAIIQVIERAALNPDIDVEKMSRLLDMQERVMARNAKAAYISALVKMKPKLPVIDRRGRIEIRDKNDQRKVLQSTPFALWEDIDEQITPILTEHGFVLTFRSGLAQDGKITVTGVLAHSEGHTEETTITLPHDSSGSKNAVQAVGSSTSYGKRYTATLLLNIRTKGDDDDGKIGGAPEAISDEQLATLRAAIDEIGADIPKFCQYLKIGALAELPANRFDAAIKALEAKRKKS